MNKETLQLWCAYPDDLLSDVTAQACLLMLSEGERARYSRFKFEKHRREYLATHTLARIALSHHGNIAPSAWDFRSNEHGKPFIEPECSLRFNLSNSPGLVVCLVGEGAEVGVDVESHARAGSIAEVGPRMFSPLEMAQLEALPNDGRPTRCLQLWTLKEAYAKARGMGLAIPLSQLSFVFEEGGQMRLLLDPRLADEASRWSFCLLDHADHCIALMAANRRVPDLSAWEARLPSAIPMPLSLAQMHWHRGAA